MMNKSITLERIAELILRANPEAKALTVQWVERMKRRTYDRIKGRKGKVLVSGEGFTSRSMIVTSDHNGLTVI